MTPLWLLACAPSVCEGQPGHTPEAALQATLEACRQALPGPGAVLVVDSPATGRWSSAVGEAALEGPAMDLDARFRAGSITKMITAAVILQLADEGRLKLTDPLALHADVPLRDAGDITVRQLLQHTSGLADYLDSEGLDQGRSWQPDELLAITEEMDRIASPGEAFHYANSNFVALGSVAESASGTAWEHLVESRVLQPLGMDASGVAPDAGELAAGYRQVEGAYVHADGDYDPSVHWSSGALVVSAGDLNTFVRSLVTGELLGPEATGSMLDDPRPLTPSELGEPRWYGLGIGMTETAWGVAAGHRGRIVGHHVFASHHEDEEITVAVALNNASSDDPRAVVRAVYEVLLGPR